MSLPVVPEVIITVLFFSKKQVQSEIVLFSGSFFLNFTFFKMEMTAENKHSLQCTDLLSQHEFP